MKNLLVDDARAVEIALAVIERDGWLATTGTERNAASLLSGATRFRDIQEKLADAAPDLLADRATMAGEIERLQARLSDCEDDARRVLADECAPDEAHCSCVPHLRREIERLRSLLCAVLPECASCPDCGPIVPTDEDGCCARCGADCELIPMTKALAKAGEVEGE